MSTARIHSRYRPRAPRGLGIGGLSVVLLALSAVIAMHGIDPVAAARATGSVTAHHIAVDNSTTEHSHPDTNAECQHSDPAHEQCPGDQHRHHGQVCQSGALNQGFTLPALTAAFEGLPADQSLPLIATAAEGAAWGSGCGPPSLLELSISRT